MYQHSKKDDPKNYFNFEEFFPIAFLGNAACAEIEKVLTTLDPVAWEKLRKKALSQVTANDPLCRYHQLFDALNEARGYGYLLEDGQTEIEFIEDLTGKSPDLLAWKNGAKTLLEVKTLNQSDDDIMNEDSRRNEAIKIDPTLSVGFETRIKRSIRDARKQLDRYSAERKIVYLFAEMESHQRTCFESYNKLKLFIADQNINDLRVVGLASPMMICF